MDTKCAISVLIIAFAIKSVRLDDLTALQNEIMDSNYNGDQMNYNRQEIASVGGGLPPDNSYDQKLAEASWLDSARSALSGPAGQIVVHVAKEMINRSTGNSQVCLTNDNNYASYKRTRTGLNFESIMHKKCL